jgi:hypothetical protein
VQRAPDPFAAPHHDRRWLILGIIGIAQLMVVLDVTIVNMARRSRPHTRSWTWQKAWRHGFGLLYLRTQGI